MPSLAASIKTPEEAHFVEAFGLVTPLVYRISIAGILVFTLYMLRS